MAAAARRDGGAALAEVADVCARDEAAAVTDQDHGVDGGVGLCLMEAGDDPLGDAGGEGVDRRVVDDDDADVVVAFEADERCVGHGRFLPFLLD